MALLTPEQLAQIQQIIRDASTALGISTMGMEASKEDLQRLVDHGLIDPSNIANLTMDAFTHGSLMARLPEAANMSAIQFKTHLERNPIPLSPEERAAVEVARDRAGRYCVGLGDTFNRKLNEYVTVGNQELAQQRRDLIQDKTAWAVQERQGRKSLAAELRRETQDMTRNWERIASTEMQLAHQEGYHESIVKQYGEGELMAKIPEPSACPDCVRLYLEDGLPKIRPASWWEEQGISNVGRKRVDWNPVLGAMHPWCQCQLVRVPRGWEFNEEWDMVPPGMDKAASRTADDLEKAVSHKYISRKPKPGGGYNYEYEGDRELPITWQRSKFSEGYDHAVVEVSLKTLDRLWSKDPLYLKPEEKGIKDRKARLAGHMGRGKVRLEAPEVWYDQEHDRIGLHDGRHRLAVLRDLGVGKVQVAMPKKELEAFLSGVSGAKEVEPGPRVEWRKRPQPLPAGLKKEGRSLYPKTPGGDADTMMAPVSKVSVHGQDRYVTWLDYGGGLGKVWYDWQAAEKNPRGHTEPMEAGLVTAYSRKDLVEELSKEPTPEPKAKAKMEKAEQLTMDLTAPPKAAPKAKPQAATGGGYFVGPRGGKWADAAHTIPWQEGAPKKPAKEKAEKKKPARHDIWGAVTPEVVKQWRGDMRVMSKLYRELEATPEWNASDEEKAAWLERFHRTEKHVRTFTSALERWGRTHVLQHDDSEAARGNLQQAFWMLHDHRLFPTRYAGETDQGKSTWEPSPDAVKQDGPKALKATQRNVKKALDAAERYIAEKDAGELERRAPEFKATKRGVQFVVYGGGLRGKGSEFREEGIQKTIDLFDRTADRFKELGIEHALEGLKVHLHAMAPTKVPYEYQSGGEGGDMVAGFYQPASDTLRLFPLGQTEEADTLVHEIGHRIHFRMLGNAGQAAWAKAVDENTIEVKREHIDQFMDKYASRLTYKIGDDDKPDVEKIREAIKGDELASVFKTFTDHSPVYDNTVEGWRKHFHKFFEEGERVNKEFVTDYAATNDHEMFAEAFKLYVTEGPRAVPPWIRQQFKSVMKAAGAELRKSRKLHDRTDFQDFPISIENRKGSIRHWYDKHTDTKGQTRFEFPYGYIRLTEGTDGDHVDVFIGPDESARNAYVIHQMTAPDFKKFDEDKVMLGFGSLAEAKAAYLRHYDQPGFYGSATVMTVEKFREKVFRVKRQMIKKLEEEAQLDLLKAPAGGTPTGGNAVHSGYAMGHMPATTGTVATMGHHSKPARTAGENILDGGRVSEDFPVGKDKPRPRPPRKIVPPQVAMDVVGNPEKHGWARPHDLSQVDELEGKNDRSREVESGKRYRDSLEEQRRRRRGLVTPETFTMPASHSKDEDDDDRSSKKRSAAVD